MDAPGLDRAVSLCDGTARHGDTQKKFYVVFLDIERRGRAHLFLSTLWIEPSPLLYVLAGIGAIAQGCGLVLLGAMAKNDIKVLPLSKLQALLMKTAVFLVFIKIALQLLTALPYFARIATMYLDLTIGYLHMTFLGMISIGLFFLVDYFGLFVISKKAYQWYFWGFLVTEILIFYKGFAAWAQWPIFKGYMEILALVSLSILCGLLLLMALNRNRT